MHQERKYAGVRNASTSFSAPAPYMPRVTRPSESNNQSMTQVPAAPPLPIVPPSSVDLVLDERKMYNVEWRDGNTFGFTVTPVKSDRGPVLLLTRRTTRRAQLQAVGLEAVVPGDMLIAIGDEKVYELGAENATQFLRCVRKPVQLTFQLSPYGGNATKNLPELAPNEYNYLWETGSLGVIFGCDEQLRIPVVKRIKGKVENLELLENVEVGDQLIYVNDIATCEHSMSKIMDTIKNLPKPILLRFRKPLQEDALVAEIPQLQANEFDFLWEYGPLGLVIAHGDHGIPFVRSFTGKGTSRQLAMVHENDEIVLVNDKVSAECGFTEIMNYLMNVPKPAVIRFRRSSHQAPSTNRERRATSDAARSLPSPLSLDNQASHEPPQEQEQRASLPSEWLSDDINGCELNRYGNKRPSFFSALNQMPDMASLSIADNQSTHQTAETSTDPVFAIDPHAFYQIQWTDGPFGLTVREADSTQGTVMLITKRTGRETCAGLRRVAIGDTLIQIGDRKVSELGFERATLFLRSVPKPVALIFQAID